MLLSAKGEELSRAKGGEWRRSLTCCCGIVSPPWLLLLQHQLGVCASGCHHCCHYGTHTKLVPGGCALLASIRLSYNCHYWMTLHIAALFPGLGKKIPFPETDKVPVNFHLGKAGSSNRGTELPACRLGKTRCSHCSHTQKDMLQI